MIKTKTREKFVTCVLRVVAKGISNHVAHEHGKESTLERTACRTSVHVCGSNLTTTHIPNCSEKERQLAKGAKLCSWSKTLETIFGVESAGPLLRTSPSEGVDLGTIFTLWHS